MLQQAVYQIKTQMGISDGHYQDCDDFPVFGTGQCSKSSPPIWNFNSSVYFDAFDAEANGATYYLVSGPPLKIYMTGFVDDNNYNCNKDAINHKPDPDDLICHSHGDAQLWHDLLWTSGEALKLSKCQYHLIDWNFTSTRSPIQKVAYSDLPNLCIKQLNP
jgi:hypothetical protein